MTLEPDLELCKEATHIFAYALSTTPFIQPSATLAL